jgi:hypothetical protein
MNLTARVGTIALLTALGSAAATTTASIAQASPVYGFQAVPAGGTASSIGVGPWNDVWITGTHSPDNGGYDVYELQNNNSVWTMMGPQGTAGTQIAVDGDGVPFLINRQGSLYEWASSAFNPFGPPDTCAHSVGVDQSEYPWVIACSSTQDASAGYDIQHWNGSTWDPPVPGAAGTQITVSSTGVPWVINAQSEIFAWNGTAFAGPFGPPGTCARSIGIGPDGNPWVVGCSKTFDAAKGYDVWHWDGASWEGPYGAANQIAVSSAQVVGGSASFGTPWIVDAHNVVSELGVLPSTLTWHWGEDDFGGGGIHGMDLTLGSDGSYTFSGQFWENVFPGCSTGEDDAAVIALKAANGDVLTFSRSGSLSGGCGSQNDGWSLSGTNASITSHWAGLQGVTAQGQVSFSLNTNNLWNAIASALGAVSAVISIVGG